MDEIDRSNYNTGFITGIIVFGVFRLAWWILKHLFRLIASGLGAIARSRRPGLNFAILGVVTIALVVIVALVVPKGASHSVSTGQLPVAGVGIAPSGLGTTSSTTSTTATTTTTLPATPLAPLPPTPQALPQPAPQQSAAPSPQVQQQQPTRILPPPPPSKSTGSGPERSEVPSIAMVSVGTAHPTVMTSGPDGALWFLDNEPSTGGIVGRTTLSGSVATYAVPNAPEYLGSRIVTGPDGDLWFGQYFGPGIARIDTSGNITVFPVDCGDVNGVTVGPDGNIWFTQPQCHSFGKITTAGVVTRYQLGSGFGPYGIVASGNNIWFAASTTQIAETTTDGDVSYFSIATSNVAPAQLTTDADGDIWFTEDQNSAIGRLSPSGDVSSFPLTPGGHASSIVEGPDGSIWFTEQDLNAVGRVTPEGLVDQFPVPASNGYPSGMTIGPDKSLWFTAQGADAIGHITLS